MSAGIGGPLGSGQKDVQRLRSYRGNCRVEHQCGTGSERPGHYRHTYSRIQRGSAGLASASGTGRCRGELYLAEWLSLAAITGDTR